MKSASIILCLLGIISNAYSQDTIQFTNKSVQSVKVSEVGIDEIKYHRFDNLEGPLYVANKKEIRYIKYVNGHVDSVTTVSTAKPISTGETMTVYKLQDPISSNEKIAIFGNKLSYNGKEVGEVRLLRIISNVPNQEKKTLLLQEFTAMKSYKKKQYLFGFLGLGLGVGGPVLGIDAAILVDDPAPILVGLGTGLICGVTGAIISAINKNKRMKKRVEIAELYNK